MGSLRSSGESRTNVTEFDVRVDDLRVGNVVLNIGGHSGSSGTCSARNAWSAWVRCDGVVAVQPQHIRGVVVPDGEYKHHTRRHALRDARHTAVCAEAVAVAERLLRVVAEGLGDGVVRSHAGDVDLAVLDDLAVLHVDAANFLESARSSAAVGDELSDDSHLLGGIDRLARAVEVLVAHAERVEIAPVGIAGTAVAVAGARATTTRVARAARLLDIVARMGSDSRRDRVGLPDVHLVTAAAVIARSGVRVVARGLPPN